MMTNAELHELINRYFNGETSIEEERTLRQALASPPDDAPTIDHLANEARAVMGFSLAATARKVPMRKRKTTSHPPLWKGIAAAVVAAVAIGTAITGNIVKNDNECVAYLNGIKISDRDAVMEMMFADMTTMGEASADIEADITEDLNEIAGIMNRMD